MNLLKDESGLLGNADFITAHDTFDSFLIKARTVRHLQGSHLNGQDQTASILQSGNTPQSILCLTRKQVRAAWSILAAC